MSARAGKKPTAVAEHQVYEFGGPLGAAGITFGLPLVVYLSTFLCNDISGCPVPSLLHPASFSFSKLAAEIGWPPNGVLGLIDFEVIGWVIAYHLFSLAQQLLLPGSEAEGTELAIGGKHKYKFNGFLSAMITLAGLALGTAVQGVDFPVWPFIWNNLNKIITANMLIATVEAIYVYIRSFSVPPAGKPNPAKRELAAGGHTGNMFYDFFIGRELNPRIDIPESIPLIGGQAIDIKVFNEVRPGLLGWVILDLAFTAQQYKVHGFISDSMLLTTAFQTLYALDAVYQEPGILSQIDITTDGFGFMLAFGDLPWLPFIYSLQCRYLAVYPVHLGAFGIISVLAIQAVGYYIFRASNNEKGRFRADPNDPRVAHLKYITTASGTKLLSSGWWGRSRHPNYLGDLIMSLSYCMPTGISGYIIKSYTNPVTGAVTREVVQDEARGWGMIFTYFYILYFATLLIHRERRDEEKCRKKYGKDWDKYCELVKSRIIPGVY